MNGLRFRSRLMDEGHRWEGNKDRQFRVNQSDNGMRRKNNGYVAYINEEEDFYPNARAPMNGEIVGAIY